MKGDAVMVKGLELAERFFWEEMHPLLQQSEEDLLSHGAFGVAGPGSECLGFDDAYSRDHDFTPMCCIWIRKAEMETYGCEIQRLLPAKSEKEIRLVEQIIGIYMGWYEEVQKQIPNIMADGRPLRSSEDKIGDVSIETYLRGELKTYSEASLEVCLHFLGECEKQGRNLVRENYQEMAGAYGYESLERAEKCMGRK